MSRSVADFRDLTPAQHRLLTRVEREEKFTRHFYLTGGTLLKALGIVPRQSNDLDFFTFPDVSPRAYTNSLVALRLVLEELFGADAIVLTKEGFLHTESRMVIDAVSDAIPNISEFGSFGRLRVAGLKDLAAHKASAVCSRDEVKDYIDIAFLTKHQGWALKDLAEFAEEKFRLGTISEEKLVTELLDKRDHFTVPPTIFLRSPEENSKLVQERIADLINRTTL